MILTSLTFSGVAADGGGISQIRDATRDFRQVDAATAAGYSVLTGTRLEECIDEPGEGTMGFHYVNGDLVGDALIDLSQPEALLYLPGPGGELELLGVEYVIFAAAWDAENDAPPSLLGHEFQLVAEPNRYELSAFYALHAWAWKDNPNGAFSNWNPTVSCPNGELPDTSISRGSGAPLGPGVSSGVALMAALLVSPRRHRSAWIGSASCVALDPGGELSHPDGARTACPGFVMPHPRERLIPSHVAPPRASLTLTSNPEGSHLAHSSRTWTGARTPQAIKRVRQAASRRAVLQPRRTAAKTYVAKALTSAETGEAEPTREALIVALSALDRAAKVGAIHPNAADRRKSRLMLKINAALGGETLSAPAKAQRQTGKTAAAKQARARIAASRAVKAKGEQTAAGKARAALTRSSREQAAAAATVTTAPTTTSVSTTRKRAPASKPAAKAASPKTATTAKSTTAKAGTAKSRTAKTSVTKASTAEAKPAADES